MNKLSLPQSIDNTIGNITGGLSKSIGEMFNGLFLLIFGDLIQSGKEREVIIKLEIEQFEKQMRDNIKDIPDNKLVKPNLQTVGQALELSKFTIEEPEIRDMFAKLIVRSMNSDFASRVHPSFSAIISQMSPIDARILSLFSETTYLPTVNIVACTTIDESYESLIDNVLLVKEYYKSHDNVAQAALSVSSLIRLGILQSTYGEYLDDNTPYAEFELSDFYQSYRSSYDKLNWYIDMRKALIRLTTIGKRFVEICLFDDN